MYVINVLSSLAEQAERGYRPAVDLVKHLCQSGVDGGHTAEDPLVTGDDLEGVIPGCVSGRKQEKQDGLKIRVKQKTESSGWEVRNRDNMFGQRKRVKHGV